MSTTTPSSSSTRSKTACCSIVANGIKRGPWTPEEDEILANFVKKKGEGRWRTLPQQAGLQRCGKSCRLRWMNYLRPSVKRGRIGLDEEDLILRLHRLLGNRWSLIAGRIPGRTGNEIKNYWNTHLSKKLIRQGIDPRTHKPLITTNPNSHKLDHESNAASNPPSMPQTNSINNPAPDMGSSSQINAMKYCQNMEGHNSSTKNWPSCDYVMSQDKNICEEDTLSSFMDSLLNDNEVAGNVITASPHPITSSMQSLDLGFWEVELTSTADALGDEQFGSLFK